MKKRIISLALVLSLAVALTPAATAVVNSYTEQLEFYVESANQGGLIPRLDGYLSEHLTYDDLIDFLFDVIG